MGDGDTVFFDGGTRGPKCERGGGFGEGGHTSDASVLLVRVRIDHFFFGGADGREDVWLPLIIA